MACSCSVLARTGPPGCDGSLLPDSVASTFERDVPPAGELDFLMPDATLAPASLCPACPRT